MSEREPTEAERIIAYRNAPGWAIAAGWDPPPGAEFDRYRRKLVRADAPKPDHLTGICSGCHRSKRLRDDGTIPEHTITLPVSERAMHTAGLGRRKVERRCSGAGKPPTPADPP